MAKPRKKDPTLEDVLLSRSTPKKLITSVSIDEDLIELVDAWCVARKGKVTRSSFINRILRKTMDDLDAA